MNRGTCTRSASLIPQPARLAVTASGGSARQISASPVLEDQSRHAHPPAAPPARSALRDASALRSASSLACEAGLDHGCAQCANTIHSRTTHHPCSKTRAGTLIPPLRHQPCLHYVMRPPFVAQAALLARPHSTTNVHRAPIPPTSGPRVCAKLTHTPTMHRRGSAPGIHDPALIRSNLCDGQS